jgi:glyoxylase-like metal-dependent hydrolase (beta-lactamase superfamily II)
MLIVLANQRDRCNVCYNTVLVFTRGHLLGGHHMANNKIRIGNVEILSLSDGVLEFDLCNFFPTIPQEQWQPYENHLTVEHHVQFNLGSFLVRSDGRTISVDTGIGPKPVDGPKAPGGQLLNDLAGNGVRPEQIDMVVTTHLHHDHVGWNLMMQGEKFTPTFPNARYWISATEWEACHQPAFRERFRNAPTRVWPLADLGVLELMHGEHTLTRELTALPTPGHTPGPHEHFNCVARSTGFDSRRRGAQSGPAGGDRLGITG